MKNKLVIPLLLTLPIPLLYWFFENDKKEYDWFLFDDFSQKIKFYVIYTGFHLENITKAFIIYTLVDEYMDRKTTRFALVFVFLAVLRLAEYWLFRHHIPYIPVIAVTLLACAYIYMKK